MDLKGIQEVKSTGFVTNKIWKAKEREESRTVSTFAGLGDPGDGDEAS